MRRSSPTSRQPRRCRGCAAWLAGGCSTSGCVRTLPSHASAALLPGPFWPCSPAAVVAFALPLHADSCRRCWRHTNRPVGAPARPTACMPCLCLPPAVGATSTLLTHCRLSVQVLRTSLGPKGMDKMLQGPDGDIVISERTFRVSACCLLLPAVDAGLLCCVAGTVAACLHLPTR